MQTNRAIRATTIIILCWVGLRSSFLLLSNDAETSPPLRQGVEAALPVNRYTSVKHSTKKPARMSRTSVPTKAILALRGQVAKTQQPPLNAIDIVRPAQLEPVAQTQAQTQVEAQAQPIQSPLQPDKPTMPLPFNPAPPPRFPDLRISAWAIVRPAGSVPNLATNGQLGASQAGVRIQQPLIRIDRHMLIAINLRVSAPLDQRLGREAGLGLAVRPIKQVPMELILERRVALGHGGRNALAVIAAGGFDDKPLIRKMTVSGYAQTGMVGFAQNDGFIDGAFRAERALLDHSNGSIRLGAGLWGAAQPNVARIDAGPILAVKQRLGAANFRISAEYRWRLAGQARPASGPALTIGTDF
jgi:hypothetical protein